MPVSREHEHSEPERPSKFRPIEPDPRLFANMNKRHLKKDRESAEKYLAELRASRVSPPEQQA